MAVERAPRSTADREQVLGAQVRAARIAAALDQVTLAEMADVSVGALRTLEAGQGSSVRTLTRVVGALGRDDWLQALAPPVTVSPLAMLAGRRRDPGPRQRVSRPRRTGG